MTRKATFFEGWCWFKFNNLGLALGKNLKIYTRVAKGLKIKVRKFCGLFLTFAEVTGKKLVGWGELSAPSPPHSEFLPIVPWNLVIRTIQISFHFWINCALPIEQQATCFQMIIKNYSSLFSLRKESLLEKLDARIKGCKLQMESFNFFFCLCLSQKLYGLADKLSKTLQKTKILAIIGKNWLLWPLMSEKASAISGIGKPDPSSAQQLFNFCSLFLICSQMSSRCC